MGRNCAHKVVKMTEMFMLRKLQIPEQSLEDIELTVREIKEALPIFFTRMAPSHFFEVGNIHSRKPLTAFSDTVVLCVSAIGSANAFVKGMKKVLLCLSLSLTHTQAQAHTPIHSHICHVCFCGSIYYQMCFWDTLSSFNMGGREESVWVTFTYLPFALLSSIFVLSELSQMVDNFLQLGAFYVDQLEFSDHHIFQLKV